MHTRLGFVFLAILFLALRSFGAGPRSDYREVKKAIELLELELNRNGNPSSSLTDAEKSHDLLFQKSGEIEAVEVLAKHLEHPNVVNFLGEVLLYHKKSDARFAAASALGKLERLPKGIEAPPLIDTFKRANLREAHPQVSQQLLALLVELSKSGRPFHNNPNVANAIFPLNDYPSDFILRERTFHLMKLGFERPEVHGPLIQYVEQLHGLLTRSEGQRSSPIYQSALAQLQFAMRNLREGLKAIAQRDPKQALEIYRTVSPKLVKGAAPIDENVRIAFEATRFRLAKEALSAIVDDETLIDRRSNLTPERLEREMSDVLSQFKGILAHSTPESRLTTLRLLGEFTNDHETAVELLKKHYQKRNTLPQEKNTILEALFTGGDVELLNDYFALETFVEAEKQTLEKAIKEGAAVSIFMRNALVNRRKSLRGEKRKAYGEWLLEVFADPKVVKSFSRGEEAAVEFLVEQAKGNGSSLPSGTTETPKQRALAILEQLPLERLNDRQRGQVSVWVNRDSCQEVNRAAARPFSGQRTKS